MEQIPAHSQDHPILDEIRSALRSQPVIEDATFAQRRFAMEAMQSRLELPDAVSLEPIDALDVGAAWIRPKACSDPLPKRSPLQPVILYLHGGGYALGSIKTHQELMSRLALATNIDILGIDYRLAPESPFPAALEDAAAAYRWLLSLGTGSSSIILAGDSAGGGLCLATLLRLREAGDPLPRGAVLLSPWTDLTAGGSSFDTRKDADPMIAIEPLRDMARIYAEGRLEEPEVSPLFADLSGLPPLLVQVGDAEVLLDDSLRLAEQVIAAGGTVDLEVWEQMFHVFQAFPKLPAAQRAMRRLARWIQARLQEL